MTDPIIPIVPSTNELYDSLMSKIEPELVSSQVPLLEEKYKGETKDQRAKRAEKYKKAYKAFMKAFGLYMIDLNHKIGAYRKQAYASAEINNRSKEQERLTNLENTISSL
ncbi:MAG: hypothetical protein K9M03_03005 [Kiritimatiellales bacterium]|nr:hypothetical protein [Kiritimatiellales bacterium]